MLKLYAEGTPFPYLLSYLENTEKQFLRIVLLTVERTLKCQREILENIKFSTISVIDSILPD